MAELASSIAGLLGVTAKCSIALTEFLIAVREAPRDILALQVELKAIESVLGELQSAFASRNWTRPPSPKWTTDLGSILDWCMDIIIELSVLVKKLKTDASSSWGGRTWKSIRWTFIEGDVKKLRDRLESAKNTLGLKLQSLSTVVGMRVEGRVEEIHGGLGQMHDLLQQLVAEQIATNQDASEKALLAKHWGISHGGPPNPPNIHNTSNYSNQPSNPPHSSYAPNPTSPKYHSPPSSRPDIHSHGSLSTSPHLRPRDSLPAWPAPPPPPFPPRSPAEHDQATHAANSAGNRSNAQLGSQQNQYPNTHSRSSPKFHHSMGFEVYEAPPAPPPPPPPPALNYYNQGRYEDTPPPGATPWRNVGSFELSNNAWKGKGPDPSHYTNPQDGPAMRQTPAADTGCFIVGIHLGSTSSRVFYTFVGNYSTGEEMITEWPSATDNTTPMVPSVVYYNHLSNIIGWGHDSTGALDSAGRPRPGVTKVEDFITLLPVPDDMKIPGLQPLPTGKSRTDILADFLKNLFDSIRLSIERVFGVAFRQREHFRVKYIFAVPSMWDETAMQRAHIAAVEAGMLFGDNDNRLVIIKETEAATYHGIQTGLLQLNTDDVVLVVNCGRAFADLIAYKVDEALPSSFSISEFTTSTSDTCGSSTVGMNFSSLVRYRIDKSPVLGGSAPTRPNIARKVYAKCIMDFEYRIKSDFRNNGQNWAVDVDIEEDMYPGVWDNVGIEEGYMVFTNEEIFKCFEPVLYRIHQLIHYQLEVIHQRSGLLRNILVVGEFGEQEFLFAEIKRALIQANLPPRMAVRPMDPGAAIPKGAVAVIGLSNRTASYAASTGNDLPPRARNAQSPHDEINEDFLVHWKKWNGNTSADVRPPQDEEIDEGWLKQWNIMNKNSNYG